MIKWEKISPTDTDLINQITKKASTFINHKQIDILMSISTAHIKTPLKLKELLNASDFDLVHDVAGIIKHVDHKTGELKNCFLPRYTNITLNQREPV